MHSQNLPSIFMFPSAGIWKIRVIRQSIENPIRPRPSPLNESGVFIWRDFLCRYIFCLKRLITKNAEATTTTVGPGSSAYLAAIQNPIMTEAMAMRAEAAQACEDCEAEEEEEVEVHAVYFNACGCGELGREEADDKFLPEEPERNDDYAARRDAEE